MAPWWRHHRFSLCRLTERTQGCFWKDAVSPRSWQEHTNHLHGDNDGCIVGVLEDQDGNDEDFHIVIYPVLQTRQEYFATLKFHHKTTVYMLILYLLGV